VSGGAVAVLVAAVAAAAAVGSAVGSVLAARWARSVGERGLVEQRLSRDATGRRHHLDQVLARYQQAITNLGSGHHVARRLGLRELERIAADPAAEGYRADATVILDEELRSVREHVAEVTTGDSDVDVQVDDDED